MEQEIRNPEQADSFTRELKRARPACDLNVEAFQAQMKNKISAVNFLVRLVQHTERVWEDPEERVAGLTAFRDCLSSLQDHRDDELRELSRLAEKIKTLD
eukprot:RCo044785